MQLIIYCNFDWRPWLWKSKRPIGNLHSLFWNGA